LAAAATVQRFNDFNAAEPTFRVRDPKILRSTSVKARKRLLRIRSQRRSKQQKENQVYEQPKHLFKKDNSTLKKINRPVAIAARFLTRPARVCRGLPGACAVCARDV
jgi:hypothetical protein